MLRNLQAFRAAYESDGVDSITAPDGQVWSLFDVEHIYEHRVKLSPRQKQAIELCLVWNVREKDAAHIMGVSQTNPVAMYATLGIKRLIVMIEAGDLPRFKIEQEAS